MWNTMRQFILRHSPWRTWLPFVSTVHVVHLWALENIKKHLPALLSYIECYFSFLTFWQGLTVTSAPPHQRQKKMSEESEGSEPILLYLSNHYCRWSAIDIYQARNVETTQRPDNKQNGNLQKCACSFRKKKKKKQLLSFRNNST